mmetsp:Transcript_4292/g.6073  ORF Transcript_4292/g.6073 Transcript_4292/m.6073 type:complete len:80 (+) Transcript_4292:496-735(+)
MRKFWWCPLHGFGSCFPLHEYYGGGWIHGAFLVDVGLFWCAHRSIDGFLLLVWLFFLVNVSRLVHQYTCCIILDWRLLR